MPIKISINTKKITRPAREGKNGATYRDFVLFDKPDQYGNDGFVKEDVSKEEREAGVSGAIVGNWKHLGGSKPKAKTQPDSFDPGDDQDPPF